MEACWNATAAALLGLLTPAALDALLVTEEGKIFGVAVVLLFGGGMSCSLTLLTLG